VTTKLAEIGGAQSVKRRPGLAAGALVLVWATAAMSFYATHPLVRRDRAKPALVELSVVNFPEDLFAAVSRFSEDIAGRPMEPINVILVGTDGNLLTSFEQAGWEPTDPITIRTAWRMLVAMVGNRPYGRAPGTPTFWQGRPNERGFERPTLSDSARERHHLHLWDTPILVSATPVWVATAHLDKVAVAFAGIPLPIHGIDPAVDREREALRGDFLRTRCVDQAYEAMVTEPMMGQNALGNPFFTDGKALVVFLKCK
jgi:hypothetical protein